MTNFAKSKLGKVLIGLSFLVENILTTVTSLYLNIFLIISFKKHLYKKENNLIHRHHFNEILHHQDASGFDIMIHQEHHLHRSDKRLTFMIVILSMFTIVEHVIVVIANASHVLAPGTRSANLNLFAFLFLAIKYSMNMAMFSFFNTVFHKSLVKTFCLC